MQKIKCNEGAFCFLTTPKWFGEEREVMKNFINESRMSDQMTEGRGRLVRVLF